MNPMTDGPQQHTVPPELAGRLDSAVAALCGISRSQAAALVASGAVTVNGAVPGKASARVRGGEGLTVHIPRAVLPDIAPEAIALEVLFEDEHLVAVNKPPGMVTHPAPGVYSGTLVNALLGRMALPEQPGVGEGGYRPGIVHRLDKDTSGVIVVAKTVAAHAFLSAAFKARETEKTYLAIAVGQWKALGEARVTVPVGRHPVQRQRMTAGGVNARDALTVFTPLARAPAGEGRTVALVRARPHTGRTHQIRVHLQHLGSPILGDRVYGRDSAAMPRQALHAWALRLPHPAGGMLALHAPPPGDLLEAWTALGGTLPPELLAEVPAAALE